MAFDRLRLGAGIPILAGFAGLLMAAPALADPAQPADTGAAVGQAPQSSPTAVQQAQEGIEVPRRDTEIRRGVTVRQRERPELDPLGGRVGTFLVFPELEVRETYNDNIFATDTGEQGDFITSVAPRLRAASDWNNHALAVDGGAVIGRHLDNDNEDFEDWEIGASGRLDVRRQTALSADVRYQNLHVERSSPDDVAGVEPTEFDVLRAGAQLFQGFNRLNLRLGGNIDQFDFDDVPTSLGTTINNDDRDRDEYEVFLRTGYEIMPNYEAFVRGAYNIRDYDSAVDDNGVDRDSDGYEVVAGLSVDFGGITFGDFFAGYREQDFDDPALEKASGPVVGADITWNVTPLTTIIGSVSREIRETTTTGPGGAIASSRFFTTVGLSADHELLRNLLLGADLSYSNDDFEGIDRTDDVYRAGLDATYMMNRYVYLTGGYRFRMRDSEITTEDFTENVFLVSLQLQY